MINLHLAFKIIRVSKLFNEENISFNRHFPNLRFRIRHLTFSI